jgi:hypothetical protein
MLQARRISAVSLLAGAIVVGSPATFSDPIGVYAIIDRVELRPDASNPTSVVIWGVFARSPGRPGDAYGEAERGYLFYSLNTRNERASRAEWSDLRSVAGSGEVIGFGQRYEPTGRVRRASEAPADPDVYPIGFGLVRSTRNPLFPQITRELANVPAPVAPADGARVPAGEVRLIARNVPDAAARYVFEIETAGGEKQKSAPISAAGAQAAWTPPVRVRSGESYTWRVWVENGSFRGQAAASTFRGSE